MQVQIHSSGKSFEDDDELDLNALPNPLVNPDDQDPDFRTPYFRTEDTRAE